MVNLSSHQQPTGPKGPRPRGKSWDGGFGGGFGGGKSWGGGKGWDGGASYSSPGGVWNQFLSSAWGWINRWINGDGSKTYGNDHWNNHIRFRWTSMATSYFMCIYPKKPGFWSKISKVRSGNKMTTKVRLDVTPLQTRLQPEQHVDLRWFKPQTLSCLKIGYPMTHPTAATDHFPIEMAKIGHFPHRWCPCFLVRRGSWNGTMAKACLRGACLTSRGWEKTTKLILLDLGDTCWSRFFNKPLGYIQIPVSGCWIMLNNPFWWIPSGNHWENPPFCSWLFDFNAHFSEISHSQRSMIDHQMVNISLLYLWCL